MRRLYVVALVALSVTGVLSSVSSAGAAPGDPWVYKETIGVASDPVSQYGPVFVNNETGNILARDDNHRMIYQYDADGNPVSFPATGTNTLSISRLGLSFDNTGGPTQGNIYTSDKEGTFQYDAYHQDGSPVGVGFNGPGTYFPREESYGETYGGDDSFTLCGLGVGPNGNLWLGTEAGFITEITPTGTLTGRRVDLGVRACSLFFDGSDLYVGSNAEYGFDADNGFTSIRGSGLPSSGGAQFAVDPSTGEFYRPQSLSLARTTVIAVAPVDPPAEPKPYEVFSSDFGLEGAEGVAFDASGQTLYLAEKNKAFPYNARIRVFHREPISAPSKLTSAAALQIRARAVTFRGSMFGGGTQASYRFEYGTDTNYGQSTDLVAAPFNYYSSGGSLSVSGLQPGTTYHVRLVATNSVGTTYGPDNIFTTYPASLGGGIDSCPNALARKQTVAQRLPDCRAYELASAADTGGYDVESYLSPGQTPYPGFPAATDKLLYAVHSGAIPGPWHATNNGPDPYLATRTSIGWSTAYEGLPSDINPQAGSFSSELGEADSQLGTLAFAGPKLCDPCFTDGGLETGIPLRLSDGRLVQGMAGSLEETVPATAKPEGKVAKYFSADGKHLVFASKYAFEPGANSGGDLTVYDRDLGTSTTQIVSTDQNGAVLTGTVSELDISADGSRIVTGKQISVDPQGNEYFHPYLHTADSPNSVNLAPGTTTGVLFAGMASDGSKVFFTSADKLIAGDTDTSTDLYEADVDSSDNLDLKLVAADNSDACTPVANSNGEHWNTTGANIDCSPVAISGGGGVASATGAIYFLSPEQLDGTKGTANQPNLYLAQAGGSPSFVATLEPDNPVVLDSVKANAARKSADFQTTPNGGYAAFTSNLALSAFSTHGLRSVYRYDAGAGELDCASCDRTGTEETNIFAPAELPPNGLGLLADGRLFFTTAAQLVLNDANFKKDVYQWSDGEPALISAGSGPFDSGLLGASADGTDVFFFTQDDLATEEDKNGSQMRIYDAREGGGFFKLPATVPCQASDECHGAGTPAPGPADIKSSGKTTAGNVLVCAKNRVKKRGHCVKKPHAKKHHKKRHAKKRDAKTTGKRGGRNA
jgi:hypothetical protein